MKYQKFVIIFCVQFTSELTLIAHITVGVLRLKNKSVELLALLGSTCNLLVAHLGLKIN